MRKCSTERLTSGHDSGAWTCLSKALRLATDVTPEARAELRATWLRSPVIVVDQHGAKGSGLLVQDGLRTVLVNG